MLVEFPTTHKPHFIRQTFALLQEQGVLPLIAHIERYPYVLEDPTLLYNWVATGAYVQINAGALLDSPKLRRTLCKFISWQLVHVGHPLLGQTPAPDGRSRCCSGKGAGQRDCLKAFAERRRTFRR